MFAWFQAILGELAASVLMAATNSIARVRRRRRPSRAALDSAIALQEIVLETRTAFGSVISAQDFVRKLDYFTDLQHRFLAKYAIFKIHATSELRKAVDALLVALPPLIEKVAGHYAARSSPLWQMNPWRRLHMADPQFRAIDDALLAASNELSSVLKPYAARLAA